jgi:2-polyprenyl-6-methoxyphenol hydroxylase-like FAD-dependent oxidoreductase
MSTHFLWPRGAARLAAWGLLPALEQRGCAPIQHIDFDVGPVRLRGSAPPVDGIGVSYCPRRTVLDALLVEAAAAGGVDVIEGFTVSDIVWSDDRVVGATGRDRKSSAPTSIAARTVVGADGLRSDVAAAVGAQVYRLEPPLTCVYYSYWSGVEDRSAAFYARPGQLVLVWPTNDELTCVYVGWPVTEFDRVRRDVAGAFATALRTAPEVADRLATAERVQPFVGTRTLPNQYRRSAGPGWALLGDAGHHKDPSSGMGLSDAFLSAELLAQHVGARGTESVADEAAASYELARDAATAGTFELTLKTAELAPLSAKLEAFYRAAADRPDVIERIFGVLGGTVPVSEVYSRNAIDSVLAGVDAR